MTLLLMAAIVAASFYLGWMVRTVTDREYVAKWKKLRDDTEQLLETDRRMIHDAQELFAKIDAYATTPTRGSDE